ncbi:MAG: hypothetical protein NZ733_00750 [Aigarchaeota archaeon]|nr:hypothetical protein [Aigarchaeota archaeon]MDW8044056.1 hypothetical protein [Nitrososphaerota archaeon]
MRLRGKGIRLGLVTRDPVVASRVIEACRTAGCSVSWVSSPEELPLDLDAVIAGRDAALHGYPRPVVRVEEGVDAECVVLRAIASVRSRGALKLEVSVDPGRRMGVVVLLNGVVVASSVVVGASELVEEIRKLASCVGTGPSAVYVGSRPGSELRDLLSAIKSGFPGTGVELVPEGPEVGAPVPEDLKGDELDAYVIYLRAISSSSAD